MKFYIVLFSLYLLVIYNLHSKISVSKLSKLNNPWSIAFINNNEILITEKQGKIKLFNINEKKLSSISHNLNVNSQGQGGLLDIVYKNDRVWISYSEKISSSLSTTSIATSEFNVKDLKFTNIFQSVPPINSGFHFGSRLVLKNNYIFASIGERGKGMIAQDGSQHPGSIIRIHKDGSIPDDNPHYLNRNSWLPEIYQIGLRNPQGLELSHLDDHLYTTNHGARGGDFFGKVFFGGNYGWKILGWGGKNYSGTYIGPKWKEGFDKAIYYWVPSIGISSFVIYKGKEFSYLNGKAIIGSLKYKTLYSMDFLNKKTVSKPEIFLQNVLGKIRDIEVHPKTGKIFVISNEYLWLLEKK